MGVGHGTALPLLVSSSPLSLIAFVEEITSLDLGLPFWVGPVIWFAPALVWTLVAFLLVRAKRSNRRFFWFLGAHYVGAGFILFQFRVGLGGKTEAGWMMAWVLTYLLGQAAMWNMWHLYHRSQR
jgi:hypothetical protein